MDHFNQYGRANPYGTSQNGANQYAAQQNAHNPGAYTQEQHPYGNLAQIQSNSGYYNNNTAGNASSNDQYASMSDPFQNLSNSTISGQYDQSQRPSEPPAQQQTARRSNTADKNKKYKCPTCEVLFSSPDLRSHLENICPARKVMEARLEGLQIDLGRIQNRLQPGSNMRQNYNQ